MTDSAAHGPGPAGWSVTVPDGVIELMPLYAMSSGRASVTRRLVTVWPGARSTATFHSRPKFGPVAVSDSGPLSCLAMVMSDGVTELDTFAPKIGGSVSGLARGSAPKRNPPRATIGSVWPRSAKFDSWVSTDSVAAGWVGVKDPNGRVSVVIVSPAVNPAGHVTG